MTPVVPFDPARSQAARVRLSLHDAYSEPAIRSFVGKLRELAAVSPETCAAQFSALDATLATMLEEATRTDYALRLSERQERRQLAPRPEPFRVNCRRVSTLLQRLGTYRPAAVVVIEKLVTDMIEQLHRKGGAAR